MLNRLAMRLINTLIISVFILLGCIISQCQGLEVHRKWQTTTNAALCRTRYKVYVYPLPAALIERAEDARKNFGYHVCKKCIFEQFSLEYIIFDYFMQNSCVRTHDPHQADLFYLPIIRDVDYRIALSSPIIRTVRGHSRTPSPIDNALIEAMEKNNTKEWLDVFNVTDYYWHRRHGADHVSFSCFTACLIKIILASRLS